jgi:hypothetical protein
VNMGTKRGRRVFVKALIALSSRLARYSGQVDLS